MDSVQVNQPVTPGVLISTDTIGGIEVQRVKVQYGDDGSATDVSATNPMPVVAGSLPLPSGAATETGNLASILAKLSNDPATQTTLAAILAKIIAAPATAANQATEIASLANLDVALSTRLKAADTLAAVTAITNVVHVDDNAGSLTVDGTVAVSNFPATQPVSGTVTVGNAAGASAVNIQDGGNSITVDGSVIVTQATGTNLHAVIDSGTISLPSNAAQETGGNLAAILAKIIAAPATAANQATEIASLANLDVPLSTRLKAADTLAAVTAVTAITNALPAGTNLLGKVGIDQTTPGTTNGVQVNAALPVGANVIGKVSIDQTTPGTTNAVVETDANGNKVTIKPSYTPPTTSDTALVATLASGSPDILRTNQLLELILFQMQNLVFAVAGLKEPGNSQNYELRAVI